LAQIIDIELPDIGDFNDVEVIEILVSPGDSIAKEDSLLTLESDKATMEIPSPEAGTINEIKISEGDKINKGDSIFSLKLEGEQKDTDKEETEIKAQNDVEKIGENKPPQIESKSDVTSNESLFIPDIGDFEGVEVIEILVSQGETVRKEDSLLTLETDKATMDIPSPFSGKILEIDIKVGDRISKGDKFGSIQSDKEIEKNPQVTLEDSNNTQSEAITEHTSSADQTEKTILADPPHSVVSSGKAHASPAIRRFARELGVNIALVRGTGNKSRITKEDVQSFVKSSLNEKTNDDGLAFFGKKLEPAPDVDFSKFGSIEKTSLSRIQKISGSHLHRAWISIPHVTQFDEADITELENFRKDQKSAADKVGVKVTFIPFLMRALAVAMAEYPQFNASLLSDGETLVLKKYVNIGIAVDTPKGLMVPVVRNVNQKGIFDLASDLSDLSKRAREGKLSADDLTGGCISISSLGGIGGTQFTPIVNSPEVAILGVSRAEMQPKWNGTEFEPRLIMPYSLSYDHRVIDGALGVRFTSYLSQLLSDIRKLIL
tara:strand:- start:342 stop:1979 length:1638 start_codon:yes stop_codon:yes gene_type:complete